MDFLLTLTLLIRAFAVVSADDPVSEACGTPQYLPLGQMGIVECSFQNFHSVFWYNSTDSEHETPLVVLKESAKSGDGYLTGQFDILPNGSLVISNVTWQNDHFFRVIMLTNEEGDQYVITNVRVNVVEMSKQPHPFVEICKDELFCFTQLGQNQELNCVVKGTNPPANMTWVARDVSGDRNVSSDDIAVLRNDLYEANSKTLTNFKETDTMVLLVCKVFGPPGVISVSESMVFIENMDKEYSFTEREQKYVENGKNLNLVCSQGTANFIIWKKRNEDDRWITIISVYYGAKVYSEVQSTDYSLEETDGSMTISHAGVNTEGSYMCIYDDSVGEVVKVFDVVVFIFPESPSVSIEGCKPDERCVLEQHSTGNLTCSVKGIRPKVELEWLTIPEKDSNYISFFDEKESVIKNGDTYDVTMTSQYKLVDATQTRLAVECRVSGWHIATSALDKNIELHFLSDKSAPTKSATWIIPVVIVIVVVGIITVIFVKKRKGDRASKRSKVSTEEGKHSLDEHRQTIDTGDKSSERHNESTDEKNHLLEVRYESSGDTPLKRHKSKEDEKKHSVVGRYQSSEPPFNGSLKSKYKEMYTVVPLPNLSDEELCVNEFYVKRAFEADTIGKDLNQRNKKTETHSYNDIFEQVVNTSSRSVLTGERCKGKKTLCLQMAYDWCEGNDPMSCYETLILLDLRELIVFQSLYEGISTLLLPEFEKENIKTYMEKVSKGLIILYGFNFLTDDQKKNRELINLLSGNILLNFHVIVVTTPENIPKNVRPKPREFRLKDIDEDFQEAFITKNAPQKDLNMEDINTVITRNPFLYKLCKLPMFWALYVYVSSRRSEFPDSAVVVLREMMLLSVDRITYADKDQLSQGDKNLAMLAFEVISSKKSQPWSMDYLHETLEEDICYRYERGGLLISDYQGNRNICSKVLLDWYAAYHFEDIKTDEVEEHLRKVPLPDFENVYCFLSGLSPAYGERVFKVLEEKKDGTRELQINCLFEFKQNGGSIDNTSACKKLIHRAVTFTKYDTPSDQQSSVELLKIATDFTNIGIDTLYVKDCLQIDHCSEDGLGLESGLQIPPLPYITFLEITLPDKILKKISPILRYAESCSKLQKLQFEDCFLPESLKMEDIPRKDLNVLWNPQLKGGLKILNHESGKWKDKFNNEELSHDDYKTLKKEFKKKIEKGTPKKK